MVSASARNQLRGRERERAGVCCWATFKREEEEEKDIKPHVARETDNNTVIHTLLRLLVDCTHS